MHKKSNTKRINVFHQTVERLKRFLQQQTNHNNVFLTSPKNHKQIRLNILLKRYTEKRNGIFVYK